MTVQERVPDRSQEKVRTSKAEEYKGGALRYSQSSRAITQVLDTTIDKRRYAHADSTKPHRFKTNSSYIVASCSRVAFLVEQVGCLRLKLPQPSIKQ